MERPEADNDARELTQLLAAARRGDHGAEGALWPLVYQRLHDLARRKMADEPPGHTLQATALVHEAYLRLLGEETEWKDRRHFYTAAAHAMRRILVDRVRRARDLRRGGAWKRVPLDGIRIEVEFEPDEIIDLDQMLDRLASEDPAVHEVVMLRYFAGLTIEEIALTKGVSSRTIDRDWRYARIWLYDRLRGTGREPK